MDPTSRNLTDHQWEQAYNAYIASRERVKGASSGRSGSRRSNSGRSGDEGRTTKRVKKTDDRGAAIRSISSSMTKAGLLRRQIQDMSAYQDLRLLVNLLAYGLIGVLVISTAFMVYISTSMLMGVSALLTGGLQILLVIAVRLIVQVVIDIPDIMLYRELHTHTGEEAAKPEHIDA